MNKLVSNIFVYWFSGYFRKEIERRSYILWINRLQKEVFLFLHKIRL